MLERLKGLYDVAWQESPERPDQFGMYLAGIGVSPGGKQPATVAFRAGDVLVIEAEIGPGKLFYFAEVRGEGRMVTGGDVEALLGTLVMQSPGAAASLTSGLV